MSNLGMFIHKRSFKTVKEHVIVCRTWQAKIIDYVRVTWTECSRSQRPWQKLTIELLPPRVQLLWFGSGRCYTNNRWQIRFWVCRCQELLRRFNSPDCTLCVFRVLIVLSQCMQIIFRMVCRGGDDIMQLWESEIKFRSSWSGTAETLLLKLH